MHPGYIMGDSVKIYLEWQAQERGGDATWETVYEELAAETALGPRGAGAGMGSAPVPGAIVCAIATSSPAGF